MIFFSLDVLKSLCLWVLKFSYNMSQCGSLWVTLTQIFLSFWMFIFMYFIKIFKYLSNISSNILFSFLLPFWDSHNTCIDSLNASLSFLRFCSFFFNLFSFCSLGFIIFIVLSSNSWRLFPVYSNLSKNSSSEFLISGIVHFSYRIDFWFL